VYYAASKPHPTGSILTPTPGTTFGEDPTVTAQGQSAAGIDRVEFLAWYDGYDPDGDGRFLDWQHGYHRGPSEGTPSFRAMSERIRARPIRSCGTPSSCPTSRSADQAAGRIRDKNGVWFVTDEVTGSASCAPPRR